MQIQLFGGEKDGAVLKLSNKTTRPDIYYAVSNHDEERIRKEKDAKLKVERRAKLSKLAYKYVRTIDKSGVGIEYQYTRTPDLDKLGPPEEAVEQG